MTDTTIWRPARSAAAAAWVRLRASLPAALGFGIAYGVVLTGVLLVTLHLREVGMGGRVAEIIRTMAIGGTAAGFAAWTTAATVAGHRPASARFAAMLVATILATAAFPALVYFLKFRVYFAAAHHDVGTLEWVFQALFTGASAAYVFVAVGLRMILPLGLLPLFAAAGLFAARSRG